MHETALTTFKSYSLTQQTIHIESIVLGNDKKEGNYLTSHENYKLFICMYKSDEQHPKHMFEQTEHKDNLIM